MTIKIHIERDFSFAEFETQYDPLTGEGLPEREELLKIYDMLPGKGTQPVGSNGLRETPDSARKSQAAAARRQQALDARREPPATSAQRRLLQNNGAWVDGMTKAEATKVLTEMGF